MILCIHQPEHLPYLGFFYKVAQADLFMILDDADFEKDNVQNRNKIRTAQGWQWLTVPVKFEVGTKINQVKIDERAHGLKKWIRTLDVNYQRAKYYKDHRPFFMSLLDRGFIGISELNTTIIEYLIAILVKPLEIIKSSDYNVTTFSTQRVVDLCRAVDADVFISGPGAKVYLEAEQFCSAGIELKFTDFKHPVYKQVYDPFIPYMSAIDLLFNYGPDARDIIVRCNADSILI